MYNIFDYIVNEADKLGWALFTEHLFRYLTPKVHWSFSIFIFLHATRKRAILSHFLFLSMKRNGLK